MPGTVIASGIVFSSRSMNVATTIKEINATWLRNCPWTVATLGSTASGWIGNSRPEISHQ